jgi:hypothetical protein
VLRRVVDISLLVALSLLSWTASAAAQAPGPQATDPGANSPAGVVYAIPLDSARQDAAPHGHGRVLGPSNGSSSGSGGGYGGSHSSVGSVGSGSTPTRSTSSAGGSAARRTPPVLVPGGQPGSLVHSANGFGSSSAVPGLNGNASSGLGTVQGDGSSAPVLTIILAVVLLGAGGLMGARAWRTHPPAPGGASSPR